MSGSPDLLQLKKDRAKPNKTHREAIPVRAILLLGLKADSMTLKEQIDRFQRQSDEQTGELKVLCAFVQTSLREHVDASAERAALACWKD